MERPQPRKRDEETARKDPRPIIGPPSYGFRRPFKQPCKYFASGSCPRGDQCWFSHDPRAFPAPTERALLQRPAPERPTPAPEQPKPAPERPRDSVTPGRQQFIKRILADLVSQKADRAASSQKNKENADRPPSTARNSMHDDGSSSQRDQVVAVSPHSACERSIAAADGSNSQSSAGTTKVQQNAQSRSLAPAHAANSAGNAGPTDSQQNGYRHRAASAGTSSSAALDRGAAPQQKVPYVPLIPETDSRYKRVLCKYHKQGRCPRGDTCSFAHGASELRRKPKQQAKAGQTSDHAAVSASSASTTAGSTPAVNTAQGKAQPGSQAGDSAAVDSGAQAAVGLAQTNTEEEPAPEARKVQHSLPPIIQQLLSKTAKYKSPTPDTLAPSPASIPALAGESQAPATAASSAPTEQSRSAPAIPQAATATAGAPLLIQGSVIPGLPGGVPQFGSMPPLPPPTPAPSTPASQISFGSISQPQLSAQPAPASWSLPSAQISALLEEGTPHSSAPAEQSSGHARQAQPDAAHTDRPAEDSPKPLPQSVPLILQGALPATHVNEQLESPRPYAAHSTVRENSAPTPAMQRPQPMKRPQPARKPYMADGPSPRPSQPGSRPPPPGFDAMPKSTSRPPIDSSVHSAPSAARREPDEAPRQAQQQPNSLEPSKAAAAASEEQASAPSAAPGSSAASDSSWQSASIRFGQDAQPEAMTSPRSASSQSSNAQHSQPATNGIAQHHKPATPVTRETAHIGSWHSAPSKQRHSPPEAKTGEEDDIPQSFCCPITQELMRNPVVATDGHSYEASAIASWLESHDTSPMTNDEMSSKAVAPNKSLKAVIDLLFPVC